MQINFARHQHDTDRTQNRLRLNSRRQLFGNYCGSPGRRNNKNTRNNENTRSLSFKNPNIEPQPTNSRHITCLREGKSPSVALTCRTAKTHCLINVNKSQTRVSYFFDSHKMHLLSLFGLLPTKMPDFPALLCT